MRNKLIIALGLALGSGSALAAVEFNQLDTNNDRKLSREELAKSGVFERWDTNQDGQLSQEELAANQQAINRSLNRQ
jgi:Ca2+-binding EF-hand superfamily protein